MLLLASLTFACGSVAAQDRGFDFALIGDMPYTKAQEREYQRVLEALNAPSLTSAISGSMRVRTIRPGKRIDALRG